MQLAGWLYCRSGKRPDWLRFEMNGTVRADSGCNVGWLRSARPSQFAARLQYSKILLPFKSVMPDKHSPTTGISSRRSACDRCRTQKSKCLRQRPDQVRCDRCNHADSECSTSPIYRIRAWKGTSGDSSMESATRSSQRREGTRKRQRQEYDHQQLLTPRESNSARVSGDVSCADAAPHFEDIAFRSSDYSCAQQPLAGPLQDQVQENTGLCNSMFSDVMDQYVDGVGYSSSDPFENITLPLVRTEAPIHFGSTHTQPLYPDNNNNSISLVQDSDTPLQQLSKVDYDLVTLLGFLEKGPPEVSMDTLVSPVDESKSSTPAVDDILNRTRQFVDVLEILFEQQCLKNLPTAKSRKRIRSHAESTSDTHESDVASSPDSECSITPSPAGSSNVHCSTSLDTASLIAILSCYMRVLRLHLIVFTHVYDSLKGIAESDDPVLCPIPGLSFCTFPIRE